MIKNIIYLFLILNLEESFGAPLELSRDQCRQLIINHKAKDDVTYTPGVDVKGNAVAPADLPGSKKFDIGKSVTIDIDLPLSKYAPHNSHGHRHPNKRNNYIHDALKNSSIDAGTIRIDEDGKTWMNDEPVHDDSLEEITDACRSKFPDL